MKKIIIGVLSIVIISLALYSCEKDNNENTIKSELKERNINNEEYSFEGMTHKDMARLRFGIALAKCLSNKKIRDYIKSESIKESEKGFDTEFMYISHRNDIVDNDKTFAEILALCDSKSFSEDFFNTDIINIDPYLTIITFMNPTKEIQSWDTENDTPDLGIWFPSLNDPDIIPILDEYGNVNVGNGKDFPETVIIGLKTEEINLIVDLETMTTQNGNSLNDLLGENICPKLNGYLRVSSDIKRISQTVIIISIFELKALFYEKCSIPPSDPPQLIPPPCERDLKNTKDVIFSYKLTPGGWNYCWRGWGEGSKLEVKNFTIWGEKENDYLQAVKIDVNPDIKRGGSDYFNFHWEWSWSYYQYIMIVEDILNISLNWDLQSWDIQKHGEVIESRWIEVDEIDSKNKFTFIFGWKPGKSDAGGINASLEYTLTYDPKDEIIGVKYPEFCDEADKPGYEYNLGSIGFFNQGQKD